MSSDSNWFNAGPLKNFTQKETTPLTIEKTKLAVTFKNNEFGVISAVCNHVGGPLGEGKLDGDYVVCPWHFWKFHHKTGEGEPGYEDDKVPSYKFKIEDEHLFIDLNSATKRHKTQHAPHPLTRKIERAPGGIRVVGISTTVMNNDHPRYSTSDDLLISALDYAKDNGCETKLFKLNDLKFRACEGYYSQSARACTWPCSITSMDPSDEMEKIYEAFVHWGDAFIISTPIRWGAASSLYFKMIERMNCIQNQETIANKHLLKNKVVGFIITGGQDNVQAVAGSMLGFFAELGCQFPQFPYIAHSRGWSAEDMENNMLSVKQSDKLRVGANKLVDRIHELAKLFVSDSGPEQSYDRGGRKAHKL